MNAVLDELESLIAEIGADTDWPELESMIQSAVTTELGRTLRPDEEQRLLEAWVALEPREHTA